MLVFDIETQNSFESVGVLATKDLRVSFVGAISYPNYQEFSFWESDVKKLYELMKKEDLIIGYNIFSFDMPVIANYVGQEAMDLPMLDLMVVAQRKIGFRPKLDNLAQNTLGHGKIGKGTDALKYWEEQNLVALRDYCLEDVRVTLEVYKYMNENGSIKYEDRSGFTRESKIDLTDGYRNYPPKTESVEESFSLF